MPSCLLMLPDKILLSLVILSPDHEPNSSEPFRTWSEIKIWDEPDVFKPERHLDEHDRDSMGVTLMEPDMRLVIFSTGRRGCAGTKIGASMTIMLLARLLQGFAWALPIGASQVELIAAKSNLFMAKPLLASAKPRLAPGLYPKIQI
ncbi:unnamed protein product [Microthlaspi erraticum]|uniref:Uncharacterized protein n=1 Tax=Microthlaspi erraticum TaxID=1685480 RepID=A0A6D2KY89_9BRAS|nr:unnamed protein product [Microthlaspi erraticum]